MCQCEPWGSLKSTKHKRQKRDYECRFYSQNYQNIHLGAEAASNSLVNNSRDILGAAAGAALVVASRASGWWGWWRLGHKRRWGRHSGWWWRGVVRGRADSNALQSRGRGWGGLWGGGRGGRGRGWGRGLGWGRNGGGGCRLGRRRGGGEWGAGNGGGWDGGTGWGWDGSTGWGWDGGNGMSRDWGRCWGPGRGSCKEKTKGALGQYEISKVIFQVYGAVIVLKWQVSKDKWGV